MDANQNTPEQAWWLGDNAQHLSELNSYDLQPEYEPDYGGVFDGHGVVSDADPGL